MKFWSNRFLIAGWVFAGTLLLLARDLLTSVTSSDGAASSTTFLGPAAVAVFAGPLLGFLINSLWELYYREMKRCCLPKMGTGAVNQRALRDWLKKEIEGLPEEAQAKLETLSEVLNDEDTEDRVVYTLAWWGHAAKEYREGCHRRWEVYHISHGSNLAILLAFASSLVWWNASSQTDSYFAANGPFLGVSAGIICVLFFLARTMRRQAVQHENAWLGCFCAYMKGKVERLAGLAIRRE